MYRIDGMVVVVKDGVTGEVDPRVPDPTRNPMKGEPRPVFHAQFKSAARRVCSVFNNPKLDLQAVEGEVTLNPETTHEA
jgi:hypothetical protein